MLALLFDAQYTEFPFVTCPNMTLRILYELHVSIRTSHFLEHRENPPETASLSFPKWDRTGQTEGIQHSLERWALQNCSDDNGRSELSSESSKGQSESCLHHKYSTIYIIWGGRSFLAFCINKLNYKTLAYLVNKVKACNTITAGPSTNTFILKAHFK